MTTELRPETKFLYKRVLNFLQVLNEEQITRLRNIAIGVTDDTSFTEDEIHDLELKYRERSVTVVMRQVR